MEDWGCANKPAQTPLDHSTAAVSLDTLYLGMLAMVRVLILLNEVMGNILTNYDSNAEFLIVQHLMLITNSIQRFIHSHLN